MIATMNAESASLREIPGLLDLTNLDPGKESWQGAIGRIDRMRELTDDWDGEGAPAPEGALVDAAIRFAEIFAAVIPRAPFTTMGINGTIHFEWHSRGGLVWMEVDTPKLLEIRIIQSDSKLTDVYRIGL